VLEAEGRLVGRPQARPDRDLVQLAALDQTLGEGVAQRRAVVEVLAQTAPSLVSRCASTCTTATGPCAMRPRSAGSTIE
jgi:hypothetical protein